MIIITRVKEGKFVLLEETQEDPGVDEETAPSLLPASVVSSSSSGFSGFCSRGFS